MKPFSDLNLLTVEESNLVPKYVQLMQIIMSDIENGIFNIGEMVPSINETSMEFFMAKNTVEKAYKLLKEKGILTSVKGKGYFVSSTADLCSKRVLFITAEFEEEDKLIHKGVQDGLPEGASVDLCVYNSNPELLEKYLINSISNYDYFIFLPKLKEWTPGLKKAIGMIPSKNLLVGKHPSELVESNPSEVYINDTENIFQALMQVQHRLGNYQKMRMITNNAYEALSSILCIESERVN